VKDNGFLQWFIKQGFGLLWRGLLVVGLALVLITYGQKVIQRTAGLLEPPQTDDIREGAPGTDAELADTPTPQPTETPTPQPTETPAPTPTPTASPYAVVGADGVNVRSGPDTSNALLGFLEAGIEVPITGRDGEWWQITYNGAPGWVYGPLVTARNADQVTGTAQP